jgi:hypothetical protein
VLPANEASFQDLAIVLGSARCHGDRRYCQRFKVPSSRRRALADEDRAHRLREQADCGHPESAATSGLLAYAGAEPAGS